MKVKREDNIYIVITPDPPQIQLLQNRSPPTTPDAPECGILKASYEAADDQKEIENLKAQIAALKIHKDLSAFHLTMTELNFIQVV